MSVLSWIFVIALAGILIMIGIRAFELKTQRNIIPDSVRRKSDLFVHKMTDKIRGFVQHVLLVVFKAVTGFFAVVYLVMKRFIQYIERKVTRMYKFIRGNMEISKKKQASAYIEKVAQHKEEVVRERKAADNVLESGDNSSTDVEEVEEVGGAESTERGDEDVRS